MDWIAQKFPHFDEASQSLVRQAYTIAEKVLAEDVRFDGTPFIGHPQNVALIVSDEIGLPVTDTGMCLPCGSTAIWRGE